MRIFYALYNYLGHGRMLETALIVVKLQYGIMLLFFPVDTFIIAFDDVGIHRAFLSIPFFMSGIPSLIGLVLNAAGYFCAKWFRICGASLGMAIWVFLLTKNWCVGNIASGLTPWMIMAILGSFFIIAKGALGLPIPGSVGQR